MEKHDALNRLADTLHSALTKTFSEMSLEELQELDWFTYERVMGL